MSLFWGHLEILWERLNCLDGFLFLLHNQLHDFRAMYRQSLQQRGIGFERVRGGVALAIRDLAQKGSPELIPSGRFTVQGEGYLDLVDKLLEREAVWTIAQGYEAFETFLNDIGGAYLQSHPEMGPAEEFVEFNERPHARDLPDDPKVRWRAFFKNKYRGVERAMKAIRAWAPTLGVVEVRNNRDLDLNDWLFVLAQVRHASVHSNSKLKGTATSRWSASALDILENKFKASASPDGYCPHCGFEEAEETLSIIGDYGLLVFNSLSSACGEPTKIVGIAQPGASSGRLAPHA